MGASRERIGVFISVKDYAPYIGRAVESILGQSWRELQLVVVDDGSTDGTSEVLARLARSDSRMQVLTNERSIGAAASHNRALEILTRDCGLIAILDGDDVAMPGRLETQARFLRERPELGFCSGLAKIIPGGRDVYGLSIPYCDPVRHMRLRANPILHSTVMFRNLGSILRYDGRFPACIDYELILRLIFRHGQRMAVMPELLALYRIHPAQMSSARWCQHFIAQALNARYLSERGREATDAELASDLETAVRLRSSVESVPALRAVASRLAGSDRGRFWRSAAYLYFDRPVLQAVVREGLPLAALAAAWDRLRVKLRKSFLTFRFRAVASGAP